MEAIDERQEAARLLAGLENGAMPSPDAAILAEQLDPVYVYIIVTFLRQVYPASDPAATSVLDRVVQLMSRSAKVMTKHKEGSEDPVTQWFESEYAYADFRDRGGELVELIWDKLES